MEPLLPEELSSEQGRVSALVAWAETNPTTLSITAGLSPAHVGMFLRGEMKTLRKETAEKVGVVTGVTGAWITYGGPSPDPQHVRATFKQAYEARGIAARPSRKATPHTANDFATVVTPDAARNAASSPGSDDADVPCPDAEPTGEVRVVYDNPLDAPLAHRAAV